MTKTKRAMSLFLAIFAFLIFCCGPLCLQARAIAGVDDALIAIIIAALAAMGIIFTSTGAFQSIEEYTVHLLEEYATSTNSTVAGIFNGVQSGSNALGQIVLNNRFVLLIQSFATFIKSRFSLTNNNSVTVSPAGANINGITSYGLPVSVFFMYNSNTYEYRYVEYALDEDQYAYFWDSGTTISVQIWSEHSGGFTITEYRGNSQTVMQSKSLTQKGNIWTAGGTYDFSKDRLIGFNYSVITAQEHSSFVNSQVFDVVISPHSIGIETSTISLPYDDSEFDQGDGAILDVDAPWGVGYGEITTQIIPDAYEDAEITYDSEAAVQEQVTDTPTQSVSTNAGEYRLIGLQNVFPFCIPFDIYDFFECLAADPVAPVVNWRFYVPGICDETITLDLSQFDTVAQVVRTMELLAFIVGLALVTREKFLRG